MDIQETRKSKRQNEKIRAEIERDTKEFLRNGGKIKKAKTPAFLINKRVYTEGGLFSGDLFN